MTKKLKRLSSLEAAMVKKRKLVQFVSVDGT